MCPLSRYPSQDTTEEDTKEDKRPSVAEIRRLFDPVLADPQPSRSKELENSTPTVTPPVAATPAKLDSDDESEESSSSESEESSSETEETTVTKSPRRSRANTGNTGLPAGSEEGAADNEVGGFV